MTITAANLDQLRALVAFVRRHDVDVVFQANWNTRDAGGSFGPWVGGIIHHDASSIKSGTWGALGVIINGRPDVPGPLAQLQIARGSVPRVAVVTAGRGNHAGVGGPWKNVPRDSGNRWLIGAEVANNGVDEAYSDATLHTITVVGRGMLEVAA